MSPGTHERSFRCECVLYGTGRLKHYITRTIEASCFIGSNDIRQPTLSHIVVDEKLYGHGKDPLYLSILKVSSFYPRSDKCSSRAELATLSRRCRQPSVASSTRLRWPKYAPAHAGNHPSRSARVLSQEQVCNLLHCINLKIWIQ